MDWIMIISRDTHCKNIQFNNGKDICRSNTTSHTSIYRGRACMSMNTILQQL